MAKFNVKFSESVYRLLAGMALERGQTMADVLRDEVCRGAWLDDQLRQGHRVLIERGKGKVTELTFAHESLLNPVGRPRPRGTASEEEAAAIHLVGTPVSADRRAGSPQKEEGEPLVTDV
jgi:hypothetical protein